MGGVFIIFVFSYFCVGGGFLGNRFAQAIRMAERRMTEFKPQSLANMAWAFATVNQSYEALFTSLATAAAWQERQSAAWCCLARLVLAGVLR